MALYYFDVNDNGVVYPDDQGIECADFPRVKKEAIRALVEMINDSVPDGDHHLIRIKVRQEGGDLVLQAAIRLDVESQRHSGAHKSPDPHAEG
ncbi:DUF6894 family protein [Mesorhizobium silamurunense]|uniref:DUF6894 family protein n=1 Tax=Mesorhizobium silamurunense TaxID=499528 RepID=UPI0017867C32|nr:hypothetical protein [Mesorhizobium silamurunense]